MIGIITCVNYLDYLKVTLPYNVHHFEEVIVVTSPDQEETIDYLCKFIGCIHPFVTTAFGTTFNKWAALEEVFEAYFYNEVHPRLLANMDADILLPKSFGYDYDAIFQPGCLTTPLRRLYEGPADQTPQESEWKRCPLHKLTNHWSGYFHAFWTNDPALKVKPWYYTPKSDNASLGDTYFSRRWTSTKRRRTPFEVLHLGPAGKNWHGRVTPAFT